MNKKRVVEPVRVPVQSKKKEATTYFSTATDRSIIGTDMFHF